MKKKEIFRYILTFLLITTFYIAIVFRLFYWQIIKAGELKQMGRNQSLQTLTIPAIRGEIRSSDNFPLATNTISYVLYANPKIIEDKSNYAALLGKTLEADVATISASLSKDLFWVKLASNIDHNKKREIEELDLKNLGFQQEYTRFYPEASMAAHLIGFLGKDFKGENRGYFGIEGKYDEQLKGRSGEMHAVRDALGNPILTDIREDKKIDGRSMNLTIDRTIQFAVDKRLKDGVERYNADGGGVIVMESNTGKILAMSSFPRFDPATYYKYDPTTYINPVLSNLYEPGSTFKVLVMAGALDMGSVKPDTKCDICARPIQMGEYSIKTWNDKYFPNATMNDVIVHSDNTGMVFVGKKLGTKNMISYLKKFGLGEPTGIDLQGEENGIIRDEKLWYPIDLATASFGQGISLTPIQLVVAVNSIANGGNLLKPYVVSRIVAEDGKKIEVKPIVKKKTISFRAAKEITAMMVSAVENGEAKWAKIKNYKIAGKTGTAQIPVAGHYDPKQTIASFVGFFPADKPQVTMLVFINRPKTSIYGSETAAPIFFSIARDIIKYYNIPSN